MLRERWAAEGVEAGMGVVLGREQSMLRAAGGNRRPCSSSTAAPARQVLETSLPSALFCGTSELKGPPCQSEDIHIEPIS